MQTSFRGSLDFDVAEGDRSALASSAHQEARADLTGSSHDDSYRPWNQHFEDPAAPLDLPD